jgi:membrane protein YdbS with pleckstrin-like domain
MGDVGFYCPHCGKRIVAGDELAGRATLCPYCRGEFVVPPSVTSIPAPAPAAPSAAPAPAPAASPLAPSPAAASSYASAVALAAPTGPGGGPDEPNASLVAETVERDVLETGPTWKAYLGWILLGALLAVVVVGLFILLYVWIQIRSTRYRLTTQRLFVRRGLVAKHIEEVELYRVKDVTVDQSMWQRILRTGTVTVLSTDDSTPELPLRGVADPHALKEQIRMHYRASKRRERVGTAEFISS